MRMDAYYYSFEPTGAEIIDRILSAVATAGKGAHHTQHWSDDEDGPSYADRIQAAANEAAKAIHEDREAFETISNILAPGGICDCDGPCDIWRALQIADARHLALGGPDA